MEIFLFKMRIDYFSILKNLELKSTIIVLTDINMTLARFIGRFMVHMFHIMF